MASSTSLRAARPTPASLGRTTSPTSGCRNSHSSRSFVRARLLGSGKGVAKLVSRYLPSFTWPVRFPSESTVRALIEAMPRVQLAQVQTGQFALEAEWLPQAVRLLPVGCYVPNLP